MIGTLRFNLRLDKERKNGKCPVEVIYSVKGQRQYINSGINVLPDNWSQKDQKVVYIKSKDVKRLTQSDVNDINRKLSEIYNEIERIEKKYEIDSIPISSRSIKEYFMENRKIISKKDEPSKFMFDFIDNYIEENQASRVKGSLVVYNSLKKHLKDFELSNRCRISFENIDYAFFQAFQNFLLKKEIKVGDTTKKLQNTTIAKQLSTLKTFINYAQKHGIEVNPNYKNFVIKREKLGVITLTEQEFLSLYYFDLDKDEKIKLENHHKTNYVSYSTLAKVRDIFCFSCVTGLRYSDLSSLSWENIKGDEIRLTVTKTKEFLIIPLNGYSSEILKKYQDYYKPLPTISSQNFNIYIKELCKLVGINEPVQVTRFNGAVKNKEVFPKYELISAHVGRKTFCTLSLEKGMSAEQVMKISGHSDYKSFQRYVNVTENIKRKAMHLAWGDPESKVYNIKKVD